MGAEAAPVGRVLRPWRRLAKKGGCNADAPRSDGRKHDAARGQ